MGHGKGNRVLVPWRPQWSEVNLWSPSQALFPRNFDFSTKQGFHLSSLRTVAISIKPFQVGIEINVVIYICFRFIAWTVMWRCSWCWSVVTYPCCCSTVFQGKRNVPIPAARLDTSTHGVQVLFSIPQEKNKAGKWYTIKDLFVIKV